MSEAITENNRRVRQFLFDQIIFGRSPIDPIELWLDLGPGAVPVDRRPPEQRGEQGLEGARDISA